jgi:tetratricopeptide (TPR) repeat protein
MKESSSDMEKLIKLCEEEYKDNKSELDVIHEFQQNYNSARALRWYTRQSFLFRMLNKALRVQNIDILFLFRFFIYDIYQQLLKNQCAQPIHLYRAQLLTNDELKMLKRAIGGFITMNTFLSTTIDQEVSLAYLDSMDSSDEYEMHRVLFEIDADPRLNGIQPFANIIWLSYCFGQQEVLMMIGSIFRIVEIQHDENQACIIRLVLCSENDIDLKNAFEHLKKEYNAKDKMDLFSFGHVLCDMGNFDDAKKFYLRFLDDLPSDNQNLATCYQVLGEVAAGKGDCDLSLEWYEKLHELLTRTLKPGDSRLADSHTIIGNIYYEKNDYKHALESYNKALVIYKRAFNENHLTIAECLDKIGAVYEKEKKYFQALNSYERSLTIHQKSLPADHPNLGTAHSKVANIRLLLCHYYLALGHYNIALKIKLNSLPSDHLDIAADYRGMGHTYKARGELSQALSYYEKAAEIYRKQLPSVHPDVVEIDRSIRFLSAQTK